MSKNYVEKKALNKRMGTNIWLHGVTARWNTHSKISRRQDHARASITHRDRQLSQKQIVTSALISFWRRSLRVSTKLPSPFSLERTRRNYKDLRTPSHFYKPIIISRVPRSRSNLFLELDTYLVTQFLLFFSGAATSIFSRRKRLNSRSEHAT